MVKGWGCKSLSSLPQGNSNQAACQVIRIQNGVLNFLARQFWALHLHAWEVQLSHGPNPGISLVQVFLYTSLPLQRFKHTKAESIPSSLRRWASSAVTASSVLWASFIYWIINSLYPQVFCWKCGIRSLWGFQLKHNSKSVTSFPKRMMSLSHPKVINDHCGIPARFPKSTSVLVGQKSLKLSSLGGETRGSRFFLVAEIGASVSLEHHYLPGWIAWYTPHSQPHRDRKSGE